MSSSSIRFKWFRRTPRTPVAGTTWKRRGRTATRLRAAAIEALEGRTLLSAVFGPNLAGYTAVATAAPTARLDPATANTLLTDIDDAAAPIDLGSNTFTFYGTKYGGSQLFASTNGLITFGVPNIDGDNTEKLTFPTVSLPSPAAIAPLWDDWTTNNFAGRPDGQVLWQFNDVNRDGTPDQLIVQWNNVSHFFTSPSDITFQAILSLNTPDNGSIVFNYLNLRSGNSTAEGAEATVGIRNADPTPDELIVSYNTATPEIATGKALLISGNHAPVAHDDAYSVDESTPLQINAPGVLGNDTDADGNAISAKLLTGPAHGQVVLSPSGALTYTPLPGFSGLDSFTYAASDGQDVSGPATVSITVNPVGTAPTVSAADASGVEGSPISLNISAALVDNDNSESLGVKIASVPAGATLSAGTLSNGVWSLTPDQLQGLTLTSPDNAAADLTVTATAIETANGSSASSSATLHLRVFNIAPTANAGPDRTATEGGAVTLHGTFTDPGAADSHTFRWHVTGPGGRVVADQDGADLTFTPDDNGAYTAALTVSDDDGGSGATAALIMVANAAPAAAAPSVSPSPADEGGTVTVSGNFSDAGARDTHTVQIDFGDGSAPVTATVDEATKSYFASHRYADDPGTLAGTFPIAATVLDDDNGSASAGALATVLNVAPTIGNLTSTVDPVAVGTGVATASAEFTDPGVLDTHTATFDWGDGTTTPAALAEPGAGRAGTVTGSHAYAAAGTYTVRLTVRDDDGGEQTLASKSFVVVFDPTTGFVTGGGWIDSPAGAYAAYPTAVGKGRFGFVSKNKQGSSTPTGQTQFTLNAGNLNFHSTTYDWMAVTGARADYHGAGTINGVAGYHFQLTAIDGALSAGGIDRVRIRIWNDATGALVYDNGLGAAADAVPGTALGGGSIVIHA